MTDIRFILLILLMAVTFMVTAGFSLLSRKHLLEGYAGARLTIIICTVSLLCIYVWLLNRVPGT